MAKAYRLIKFEGSDEAVRRQLNGCIAEGKYKLHNSLSMSILDLNDDNLPNDPSFLPGIELVPPRKELTKIGDLDKCHLPSELRSSET